MRTFQENDVMRLCVLGPLGPGTPHIINTKLLKHFTCLTYNNGRSGAISVREKAGAGGSEGRGLTCSFMSTEIQCQRVHCHLVGF